MNKKVLDKEGTAYLVEKIKENFVAKKDLEPVNELPETGEPGRIYIIPEKKYINLEMVYANDYQQLIVVHDGSLNPEYLSENTPGAAYTGITNNAVKITVGGLLFSGAQGIGYEGDYEDQHGRTVHGEVYYCDTMESQEFRQIVIENGGTLMGLPVQAEIVEGLFIDDEGGITPKYTASFNYGEDIINQSPITNNYIQYIYTEEGGWQELGANDVQYDTMPEPGADNVGQIIQYTGEDSGGLEQGHFYICKEDIVSGISTYYWEEITVQETGFIDPFIIDVGASRTWAEKLADFQAFYTAYKAKKIHNATLVGVDNKSNSYCEIFPLGKLSANVFRFIGYTNRVEGYSNRYGVSYDANYQVTVDLTVDSSNPDVLANYNVNVARDYVLSNNNSLLGMSNTQSYIPTSDYNPATKKYVDDAVSTIKSMEITIVDELPVVGDTNKIYLVKDMLDLSIKYDKNNNFMLYSVCPNGVVNPDLVETQTEESGITYYALKPNTVNLTVEGYSFGPVTLAGPTTFTATDDNEYTGYAVLTPSMSAEAEQVIAENNYRLDGLNCASDVVKGIFIDSSTGKLSPPFVSAFVWPEEIVNTAVGIDIYSEYIYIEANGWERLGTINGIDLSDYATKEYVAEHTTQQVTTMPEPTSSDVGTIIQYVGETNEYYTTGHFYEVVEKEISGVVTYVWQEVAVQGESVDASDPEAVSELIDEIGTGETSTIYVENFGPNGDYDGYVVVTPTGENTFDYSYQTSDGEVINGSATITTDPVSGDPVINYGTETVFAVRQARGWHIHQDITNNHAFYEDAQWIIDQWIALGSDVYRVPNFSVDGYTLNRMSLNGSSSTYDYREWTCTFGKVYNATYYYYNAYFYTHYNYTTGTTSYLIYDETSNRKASKNGYYATTYLTSHQSLSNYLAKNNTTSFTPSGDYNPATKKYVDDKAVELEEAIEEASIQVDTMPTPSAENVGEVYQYTGPDTQDLDHGHFYEIVEKEVGGVVTYEYQDIGITVGVTTAVAPQEITDITYGAYRRYPGYSETGLQLLQNNNGQLIWGQTVNSIWIGTQAEYDALPEHFDTMIYFIKEDE